MSRLIDADALIADMEKRYCKGCERRKGVKGGKVRMLYEIGEAPCRACGTMDAMEEIDNSPTIGGWYSVDDRLPNEKINPNTHDFEYVLCYTIFGDVRAYKYGTPMFAKSPHFWDDAENVDEYVTHWQYLPEPPKEVSE